jgi:hydrogenase-1 operon protein HyaF
MKDFPLPVRAFGAGSQPGEDDELQFLAMPREMNTFEMPRVPEDADAGALRGARDVLAGFLARMSDWDPASPGRGPDIDLRGLSAPVLAIVDDMLGEGEVAVRVDGERPFRIQESVFTGVWRVCMLDDHGRLLADWLEAGALPPLVGEAARAAATTAPPLVDVPVGAMNSPALLAEIGSQMASRVASRVAARNAEEAAHVINLTLFPLTPDDHRVLEQALPVGPVAMISRGFGNCHITSTRLRDVWRVQYFNSMKTLILNTVEVVDVPAVALAAPEDLVESRQRMAELIAWMGECCADATEH